MQTSGQKAAEIIHILINNWLSPKALTTNTEEKDQLSIPRILEHHAQKNES